MLQVRAAALIRAHQVEPGSWIAEPAWSCRADHIPLDALPLHRGSKRFATRSEAVEDAMNRGLRMVRQQWHRDSGSAAWLAKAESLRAWLADAIYKVRAHDETLPLRGLTVVDLFAGRHGGFSMGLTSLGATIELACEIDPEARSVFERNVLPSSHARRHLHLGRA